MSNYNPIFRSPITPVAAPAAVSSPLNVADLTGVPVILIQGEAGDLLKPHFAHIPARPGDLVEVDGGLLARLAPTELYLFGLSSNAELPSVAVIEASLAKGQRFAHATDYTHGKAVIRLVGAAAPELLSKVCGLDFEHSIFPNLHVAQTSAAKIKTLIARCDVAGVPTYFLHVNRPLGQYFWEVVWDAGQEFDLTTAKG
jgi:heterotetrameric sarcosine oxidase gamma subunit